MAFGVTNQIPGFVGNVLGGSEVTEGVGPTPIIQMQILAPCQSPPHHVPILGFQKKNRDRLTPYFFEIVEQISLSATRSKASQFSIMPS
jgi:hypothetical protein